MPSNCTEQVTVPFYEDSLIAAQDATGKVFVGIKRICESLGLGFSPQLRKLKGQHWATVITMITVEAGGKRSETSVIPLGRLPMWLATIDPGKVAEHLRDKLMLYQEEAADALARHFFGSDFTAPAIPATTLAADLLLAQAEGMHALAETLVKVIKEMRALERRIAAIETRLAEVESRVVETAATARKAMEMADDDVRYLTVFGTPGSRSSGSPTGRSTLPAFACRTTAAGTGSNTKCGGKGRGAR